MDQLRKSTEYRLEDKVQLDDGRTITLARWGVPFDPASPPKLSDAGISKTYLTKPLVDLDGESLFGELAIARILEKDGWKAVWVDSFHGRSRRLLWRDMPHLSDPVHLTPGSLPDQLFDRLVEANRGTGGFFDVFAWRSEEAIFLEYKGPGDSPNRNERRWIGAALDVGIQPEQLYIIESPRAGRRKHE